MFPKRIVSSCQRFYSHTMVTLGKDGNGSAATKTVFWMSKEKSAGLFGGSGSLIKKVQRETNTSISVDLTSLAQEGAYDSAVTIRGSAEQCAAARKAIAKIISDPELNV